MAKYKNKRPTIFKDENDKRYPASKVWDESEIAGKETKELMILNKIGTDNKPLANDLYVRPGKKPADEIEEIVIGVPSDPAVVWDVLSASHTAELDGGIYDDGTGDISEWSKSSVGYVGDIHITYYLNTLGNPRQVFIGYDDNATVDSSGVLTGVQIAPIPGNANELEMYVNSVPQPKITFTQTATNKFELIRTGTNLVMKLDDVEIYNDTITVATVYPAVRILNYGQGMLYESTVA